jgi:hypothetical protein
MSLTALQKVSERGINDILGQTNPPAVASGDESHVRPCVFMAIFRVLHMQSRKNKGSKPWMLATSIKPGIAPLVKNLYGFSRKKDSKDGNAQRAKTLLEDMNFVYKVCRSHSRFATHRTHPHHLNRKLKVAERIVVVRIATLSSKTRLEVLGSVTRTMWDLRMRSFSL